MIRLSSTPMKMTMISIELNRFDQWQSSPAGKPNEFELSFECDVMQESVSPDKQQQHAVQLGTLSQMLLALTSEAAPLQISVSNFESLKLPGTPCIGDCERKMLGRKDLRVFFSVLCSSVA